MIYSMKPPPQWRIGLLKLWYLPTLAICLLPEHLMTWRLRIAERPLRKYMA